MKVMSPKRAVVAVVLMAFVVVSCGQKPNVHQEDTFAVGGPGGLVPTDGATGLPTTGPGGGPILSPGATTGPGTGPGGGGPAGPVAAGSRVGITDTTITVGLHAPITGAAPIEAAAFRAGNDMYWKYLHNDLKQKVLGRTVEVIWEDDKYTPSTAVQKCNDMSKKAFLLIGGAGTDQINACAGFADERIIPYLSPGVQEVGLNARRTYFAVTMTYKQQMPLLVQLLQKENATANLGAISGGPEVVVGHIRPNTPNFNDADDALRAAVEAAGWTYRVYTVVKEGRTDEAAQVANSMEGDDVDIAVPITPPAFTFQLANATGGNNFFPRFAGVGISNNVNQMINQACNRNQFDEALFFSPWPGWKDTMQGTTPDKDFAKAAAKYASNVNRRDTGGDLLIALWGIMKLVHQMLVHVGEENLSREGFIQQMGTFKYSSGFFPSVDYSKSKPFGASNVNVLIGSCNDPGDASKGVQSGHQWITYSKYKGLKSSF